jgi:hypothetical protein
MPKEIASRLFKSLAMTSGTPGFYYDAVQLAATSFEKREFYSSMFKKFLIFAVPFFR